MPDMNAILAEVEQALPKTKWSDYTHLGAGAISYTGESESGWRFTVAAFDLPDGSRGYDGAASKGNVVMHLTRELAEKAFKLAAPPATWRWSCAAPPTSVLQEVAEIICKVLLTHEGKTITPELARERANNAAQALAIFEISRRP